MHSAPGLVEPMLFLEIVFWSKSEAYTARSSSRDGDSDMQQKQYGGRYCSENYGGCSYCLCRKLGGRESL